jgi:poly-gamma-glutamate synthesis protein (capsule biosynthesis protein)
MTNEGSVYLVACGDILLHGRYDDIARRGEAGGVLAGLAPLLAGADLVVGNMETVLAENGTPRDDKLCLKGDPRYAAAIAGAGFDALTLANNHCMDYGPEALAETRANLERAGIGVLGAGSDREEATRPLVLERNGLRIGLIAACHASTKPAPPATTERAGIAPLEAEALIAAVAELKARVDHVIVLPHWGLEYAHHPTPEQVELARRAIEAGASAVLGHHSHAIQGIETHAGGVIAYSLANLTDAPVDWQGPKKRYEAGLTDVDREAILVRLRLTRVGVELIDTPALWLDEDGRPTPADGERAAKIARDLAEYSRVLRDGDLEAFWADTVVRSRVSAPLATWWRSGSLWDKIKGFRPGQLMTLYLLVATYLKIKLSRSESKWLLFNARNDTRPMPSARSDEGERQ